MYSHKKGFTPTPINDIYKELNQREKSHLKFKRRYQLVSGFTLIELLVVVAIIGVLASVVLGALNDARAKARDARRASDIKTIQNALELYYIDHGQYPVRSWTRSYTASTWSAFGTQLGIDLPVDPINESSSYSYNGGKNYIYYSAYHTSYGGCPAGQWYMLIYSPERTINASESPGFISCITGAPLSVGANNNAITVGVSPRG